MSKLNLLVLNSDNTGFWRKCKTKGNKVMIDRIHKPEFTEGRSIFPVKSKRLRFFTSTKRIGIWVYGTKTLLNLEEKLTKIVGTSWTWLELEDYLAKVVHLSLVKEKPFSNLQIYLMMGILGVLIILQILVLRRVGV